MSFFQLCWLRNISYLCLLWVCVRVCVYTCFYVHAFGVSVLLFWWFEDKGKKKTLSKSLREKSTKLEALTHAHVHLSLLKHSNFTLLRTFPPWTHIIFHRLDFDVRLWPHTPHQIHKVPLQKQEVQFVCFPQEHESMMRRLNSSIEGVLYQQMMQLHLI